jgi:hypothetical protein
MKPSQEQAADTANPDALPEESRRQPVWHVIVLTVLTLFAYSIVWFFKNWNQLVKFSQAEAEHKPMSTRARNQLAVIGKTNPYIWAGLLLLPGIQLLATTRFFSDVARIYPHEAGPMTKHPLLFGIVMSGLMVGLLCLAQLPGALYLLFLSACLPLAAAQHMLNQFWQEQEPKGLLVRQAFSVSELLALILGSLVLGLIITGLINPAS